MQIEQFAAGPAHLVGVGVDEFVMHHKETGIKTAAAVGGSDRPGNKIHFVQGRLNAVGEVALPDPVTCCQSPVCPAADHQTRLLVGFANGGQGQATQLVFRNPGPGTFIQSTQNRRVEMSRYP